MNSPPNAFAASVFGVAMSQHVPTGKTGNESGDLRVGDLIDLTGIVGFLKRKHPFATALNVEVDTGISSRTVECWLERRSRPSLTHGLTMACVYGPDFLAAAFRRLPRWLDEARRREELAALDRRAAEIAAQRHRLAAGE